MDPIFSSLDSFKISNAQENLIITQHTFFMWYNFLLDILATSMWWNLFWKDWNNQFSKLSNEV